MPPNDHDGHRKRMRERFIKSGLTGFAPHEAVELLLFYAIPRRDVNALAHRLVRHFGSVAAMLEATPDQLQKVPGIGEGASALIALIAPLYRYAERERLGERPQLINFMHAKAYCKLLFAGEKEEVLYVICLDAQGRVIRAVDAIHGTIDEIAIYPRTIVGEALRHNAHSILLAHNHPSGLAEPSDADIKTTDMLRAALLAVDIRVLDHIIYGDGECTSMAQWQQAIGVLQAPDLPKAAEPLRRITKPRTLGEETPYGGFGPEDAPQ